MRKIKESMTIDSWGRLHDEDSKILYPYDKIGKFVKWFQDEYGEYALKQGWAIFDSDTEVPNVKYNSERTYNGKKLNGYYWQVQRLDNPDEDEALFGKLKNDLEADELAKKLGLMIDEYGVVYGYDGVSFLEEKVKESFILNFNEYNEKVQHYTIFGYINNQLDKEIIEFITIPLEDYFGEKILINTRSSTKGIGISVRFQSDYVIGLLKRFRSENTNLDYRHLLSSGRKAEDKYIYDWMRKEREEIFEELKLILKDFKYKNKLEEIPIGGWAEEVIKLTIYK